jgi:tRNA-dihydrouridine synthase
MQGLQDDEFRNLISEYGEPHASLYKQLVHDINYLNPEKLNR